MGWRRIALLGAALLALTSATPRLAVAPILSVAEQRAALLAQAAALRPTALSDTPEAADAMRWLGRILLDLGDLSQAEEAPGLALTYYQNNVALRRRLMAIDPIAGRRGLAVALHRLAGALLDQGDLAAADAAANESATLFFTGHALFDLFAIHILLGDVHLAQGAPIAARAQYEIGRRLAFDVDEKIKMCVGLIIDFPPSYAGPMNFSPEERYCLSRGEYDNSFYAPYLHAVLIIRLAACAQAEGNFIVARGYYEDGVERLRALLRLRSWADPPMQDQLDLDLALSLTRLGALLQATEERSLALARLQESADLYRRRAVAAPEDLRAQREAQAAQARLDACCGPPPLSRGAAE